MHLTHKQQSDCPLNILLDEINAYGEQVDRATTMEDLRDITGMAHLLADLSFDIPEADYHIDKLHHYILQRKITLLATQYQPEN